jgi:phage gpG-like protein
MAGQSAFGDVTFAWNDAQLERLLRGPQGPVARDLARRAVRVESRAKVLATGTGGGPRVRTGRLRASITWRVERRLWSGDLWAWVGTNVEYARFVELGTSRAPAYPFLRPALSAAA